MKQISDAFAARLAARDTTLCACWRFVRADGAVFGATDHDVTLTFGGVDYLPSAGLESVTFESSSGLAPGRAAASGVLSLDFISEGHLDAGLWDGARVDVWRVDWRAPEHRVEVWSGRLSEVTRSGSAFAAELVSLKADLEKPVGRVYGRSCDADVGDARCKVDLDAPELRCDGVVVEALGPNSFVATGPDVFASGWFEGGMLTWETGANSGGAMLVRRHAGDEIELNEATRFVVAPGDAFRILAGCDKSFATCGAKFANRINFRGFPHMPGADAVLAGPASNHANDGRRRG